MTYNVSMGTLNPTIPYHTSQNSCNMHYKPHKHPQQVNMHNWMESLHIIIIILHLYSAYGLLQKKRKQVLVKIKNKKSLSTAAGLNFGVLH